LEVADVVLMNDSLERVAEAIALARRARRIVKQNLVFAGAVILLLIASNFLRGIPLPLGVVGHEGSTLLVILNGLRLLR
ncbi:heavy metal translocating P-type ATPase, partial [Paenibacillus macerans]|nr:heavy metal translocating P-type ATPase [Paenibacillus macerans]